MVGPQARVTGTGRGLDRLGGLGALKWLAIVLPLLFLGAADYVRELLFPDYVSLGSRVFFFGVLAVAISLFSSGVFRVVGKLQSRIVDQNKQLVALNSISTALAESPTLVPLLQTSLEEVLAVLRAESGLICIVDLELGEHSAVASRGFSDELVSSIQRARLCDDPIGSEVVETGHAVVVERLLADPRVAALAEREGVRSSISVPLKSHGEVAGIMAVATHVERRFGEAECELLANVGGQLGMAIRHAVVFERSLRRNREMEALLAVNGAVTSSLDLPHVLDRALEAIVAVTSAEAAEIWLLDEPAEELTLSAHRGASPDAFHEASRFQVGAGLPGLAVMSRAPVVVHDIGEDERFRRSSVSQAGFQTYCALPLLHRGEPLGVLGVATKDREGMTRPEDLRLLTGVGEVLSVAIENARLYERVQDSAVIEERVRIAREMHDGLAQTLTYVNAESQAIGKLLGSGSTIQARENLARMAETVRGVYADVREAILGLRTSPHSEGSFLPSLAGYVDSFEEMAGVETRLEVGAGAAEARLAASAEIQLMRIVQEALSNVRKHARASAATISFEIEGGRLRVEVRDDGRGFDPDRLKPRGWPRFGLQTMRERAEAVGGCCTILSQRGEGTCVVMEVPLLRPELSPVDFEDLSVGSF